MFLGDVESRRGLPMTDGHAHVVGRKDRIGKHRRPSDSRPRRRGRLSINVRNTDADGSTTRLTRVMRGVPRRRAPQTGRGRVRHRERSRASTARIRQLWAEQELSQLFGELAGARVGCGDAGLTRLARFARHQTGAGCDRLRQLRTFDSSAARPGRRRVATDVASTTQTTLSVRQASRRAWRSVSSGRRAWMSAALTGTSPARAA